MKKAHIPFNRVDIQGNELDYIQQAITNMHISGDGLFTHKCNAFLEDELRFILAHLFVYFTNMLLLFYFVDAIVYPHQWVQLVAMFVVPLQVFLTFKYFVYAKKI